MSMTDPNPQDSPQPPVRKRPRHLMDPNNPRPPAYTGRGMSLTHVQMWVMSVLAVTTLLHLSGGLVVAAFYIDKDRVGAQIGLLILGGVWGIFSVIAGRAIRRKRLLSWWLLFGWVPSIVGAYLLFWS